MAIVKSYKIVSSNNTVHIPVAEPIVQETDEQIIARLRDRFEILDDMTRAVKKGHIRSMVVSGPPGVGKSHGVERVLGKHQFLADVAGDPSLKKFEIIKGSMTALGLFTKLYEYSKAKHVLVFDDCDSIFYDDVSLNLLKAALDSGQSRRISWLSDSRLLKNEGIPNSFDFHGGIIFITNMDFDHVRSSKLRPHIEALESRVHYLDLTIKTDYEKMLRIKQIVHDGMLSDYSFANSEIDDILDYIETNQSKLRELSLRTVLKTADLCKSFPDKWHRMADVSILKKS